MSDEQSTGLPPGGLNEPKKFEDVMAGTDPTPTEATKDIDNEPAAEDITIVDENGNVEVSEFEKRMALKKMQEEEAADSEQDEAEANGWPAQKLTPEEHEALTPEQRYRRAETILTSHVESTNKFMQRIGQAFSFAMQDLEYKQQDGHKHAVFSKEILRDLFKRAFGRSMEDAANAKS